MKFHVGQIGVSIRRTTRRGTMYSVLVVIAARSAGGFSMSSNRAELTYLGSLVLTPFRPISSRSGINPIRVLAGC